jgi:hypothetical protein
MRGGGAARLRPERDRARGIGEKEGVERPSPAVIARECGQVTCHKVSAKYLPLYIVEAIPVQQPAQRRYFWDGD